MKATPVKGVVGEAKLRAPLARFSSRLSTAETTPLTNPVLQRRRASQLLDDSALLQPLMQQLSPTSDCFYNTISAPRVPKVRLRPRRSASFVAEQLDSHSKPVSTGKVRGDRKLRKQRKTRVWSPQVVPQKEVVTKGFYPRVTPTTGAVFDFQAILNIASGRLVF